MTKSPITNMMLAMADMSSISELITAIQDQLRETDPNNENSVDQLCFTCHLLIMKRASQVTGGMSNVVDKVREHEKAEAAYKEQIKKTKQN